MKKNQYLFDLFSNRTVILGYGAIREAYGPLGSMGIINLRSLVKPGRPGSILKTKKQAASHGEGITLLFSTKESVSNFIRTLVDLHISMANQTKEPTQNALTIDMRGQRPRVIKKKKKVVKG